MLFRNAQTMISSEENGQTIVDYALVVATISIASIGVLAAMTNGIDSIFQTLGNAL